MTHNSFSDFDFEKKLSHKLYSSNCIFVLARNLFLSSYFEYVMFLNFASPPKKYIPSKYVLKSHFQNFFMILLKYPLHTIHHALQQTMSKNYKNNASKHLKTNGLSFACSLVVCVLHHSGLIFLIKNSLKFGV